MDKKNIKTIKDDFLWINEEENILSILIFGSVVKNQNHKKSDIDIVLVAPGLSHFYYDCKNITNGPVDASKVLRSVFRNIDTVTKKYDVHLFEELPLYMKIDIIKNHVIVLTKDKYGMYEYFHHYRKLWNDQRHRNTMSKKAILSTF